MRNVRRSIHLKRFQARLVGSVILVFLLAGLYLIINPFNPVLFETKDSNFTSLAWNFFQPILAAGTNDGKLTIWDINTSQIAGNISFDSSPIATLKWSPNGNDLAFIGKSLVVLDQATGNLQSTNIPPNTTDLFWYDNGKKIIIYSTTDGLLIFDRDSLELLMSIDLQYLQLSISGNYMAFVERGNNSKITIFDLDSQGKITQFNEKGSRITSLTLSPSGEFLATATDTGNVVIWATRTGQVIHNIDASQPSSVAWSRDGNKVAAIIRPTERARVDIPTTIYIWDAKTGAVEDILSVDEPMRISDSSLEFNPVINDRLLAYGVPSFMTGESFGNLWIWKSERSDPAYISQQLPPIQSAEWSNDGNFLAILTSDGRIRVLKSADLPLG